MEKWGDLCQAAYWHGCHRGLWKLHFFDNIKFGAALSEPCKRVNTKGAVKINATSSAFGFSLFGVTGANHLFHHLFYLRVKTISVQLLLLYFYDIQPWLLLWYVLLFFIILSNLFYLPRRYSLLLQLCHLPHMPSSHWWFWFRPKMCIELKFGQRSSKMVVLDCRRLYYLC